MSRHPILYSFLFIFLILFFFVSLFGVLFTLSGGNRTGWIALGDIAVVEIEGPIFDATDIIKELHKYGENKSIKALVLRIDSPGGAVAPSQEIFEEVKKLKKDKKIVVSMGTVAASGAYYISVAADKIFASPGTITGSPLRPVVCLTTGFSARS